MVEHGLLREDELAIALAEQERTGKPLGEVIVELGLASAGAVGNALAGQYGAPFRSEYGFSVPLPNVASALRTTRLPETDARAQAAAGSETVLRQPDADAGQASREQSGPELEAAKEGAERARQELAELREQAHATGVETTALRAELAASESERERLGSELAASESERERLGSELAASESERDRLRNELAASESERGRLGSELAANESERDRLRKELEDLGERVRSTAARGWPEPVTDRHLLFVPTPTGYRLVERSGAPPQSGEEVEIDEDGVTTRYSVLRCSPAPLPNSDELCAYLEARDG